MVITIIWKPRNLKIRHLRISPCRRFFSVSVSIFSYFSFFFSQFFVCLCDAPPQAMKIRHVKRGLISVFMAKTQHQGTHTHSHTHYTRLDRLWHLQHAYNVVMAAPPSSEQRVAACCSELQCVVASWNTKFYSGTL